MNSIGDEFVVFKNNGGIPEFLVGGFYSPMQVINFVKEHRGSEELGDYFVYHTPNHKICKALDVKQIKSEGLKPLFRGKNSASLYRLGSFLEPPTSIKMHCYAIKVKDGPFLFTETL